jgi:hypothetical protein
MMKLTVLYVAPTDESAFDSHDDAPPYHLTAEHWCDHRVASGSAMGSPAGREAAADVGTVATGGPTTLVTEIA